MSPHHPLQRVIGRVDGPPLLDGLPDLDVLDGVGIHGRGVGVHHRVVREGRVERVPGQRDRHLVLVVPVTDEELARLDPLRLDSALEHCHDLLGVAAWTHGRAVMLTSSLMARELAKWLCGSMDAGSRAAPARPRTAVEGPAITWIKALAPTAAIGTRPEPARSTARTRARTEGSGHRPDLAAPAPVRRSA